MDDDPEPMTLARLREIGAAPDHYDEATLYRGWGFIRDRYTHRPAMYAIRDELLKRKLKVPPVPKSKRDDTPQDRKPDAASGSPPKQTPAAELTERREIMFRLAATMKEGIEEPDRIKFEAALEMFVLLWRLKVSEDAKGELLTTQEYYQKALDAGVGITYAKEAISFRMWERVNDIRAEVGSKLKAHRIASGDRMPFPYSSINAMLKPYRPKGLKQESKANRQADALRDENLKLADDLQTERAEREREQNHFRDQLRAERVKYEETIEQLQERLRVMAEEIARLKGEQ